MKRFLVALLTIGLIAGSLAAPAAAGKKKKKGKKPKKVERTAEGTYTGSVGALYGNVGGNTIGGFSFPTGAGESYVMIEVTDATGLPIAGSVGQDPDGDSFTDNKGEFCGATEEPIAIDPGVEIVVYVNQGVCGTSPSIVTTGTIKATFSNIP